MYFLLGRWVVLQSPTNYNSLWQNLKFLRYKLWYRITGWQYYNHENCLVANYTTSTTSQCPYLLVGWWSISQWHAIKTHWKTCRFCILTQSWYQNLFTVIFSDIIKRRNKGRYSINEGFNLFDCFLFVCGNCSFPILPKWKGCHFNLFLRNIYYSKSMSDQQRKSVLYENWSNSCTVGFG